MRGRDAVILGLILLPASMLALGQGASAGAPPAKSRAVHKSGKVEAGVEGGCLVLRDTKDHKLYNIFTSTGDVPKPGDEISFSGTQHDGPTACMEGIAVDVGSWKLIKAAGPEPKPLPVT
ncbi:MAG TPA: hypothetical protein VEG08_11700 [Terriglobales bacterium]|nr:hypothetical protein [Terriglobales bacterium]